METTQETIDGAISTTAFRAAMEHANGMRQFADCDNAHYWEGYQRGLRRAYHGESFGTAEEHALWLGASDNYGDDPIRRARGEGYRDGLEGRARMIKDYCTQNGGDCGTCSLVSYGRDCRNNPITA